jgi:hypothetical protein
MSEGYHLNSTREVAVSDDVYFFDIDADTPRGVKLLLLGPGDVATIAIYDGDKQWQGWFPIPGKRKKRTKT